jgi:hypothetical protein
MAYGGYPDTSFDRSRLKRVGRPTRGMSRASYDLSLLLSRRAKLGVSCGVRVSARTAVIVLLFHYKVVL